MFTEGLGMPCESELICERRRQREESAALSFSNQDSKLEHSRDSHTIVLSIPIAYGQMTGHQINLQQTQ